MSPAVTSGFVSVPNPGPRSGSPLSRMAVATARARWSAASLSSWLECPLTHWNFSVRPDFSSASTCSHSSSMRSRFRTSCPLAFFHPLSRHTGIHLVTELITYLESARIRRSSCVWPVALRTSMTAWSSARLFVDSSQPPAAQRSSSMTHAQPAGPGLPKAEPSHATSSTLPPSVNGVVGQSNTLPL